MFKTIKKKIPQDKDMPQRAYTLSVYRQVLNGKLYDNISHPFHYEADSSGAYVPLRERRPSVRSNLCRTVVGDSVALLFCEGNFPRIELDDEDANNRMQEVLQEIRLNEVMIDAATRGSIGSVAIVFRVLKKRIFLSVMESDNLTPHWDDDAPDTLVDVTEKYKVSGQNLSDAGYTISKDDLGSTFWFMRVFTGSMEEWYTPWKTSEKPEYVPKLDKKKSVKHDLGFVPVVWIKNLPCGDDIDGSATFNEEAIDCQIECDYQLSQAGRALKFMGDPTLVLNEDSVSPEPRVKGAGNSIIVGSDGDAKLLEINGTATAAVLDYVQRLRELAVEGMSGNKASNEKIAGAQSGRAMELMYKALISLTDKLRISYGNGAIIDLVKMIIRASNQIELVFKDGTAMGVFDKKLKVNLRWSAWFAPTLMDLVNRATALKSNVDAGIMSRKTAIRVLAAEYDITDVDAEMALADADIAQRNADAQVQVKINE